MTVKILKIIKDGEQVYENEVDETFDLQRMLDIKGCKPERPELDENGNPTGNILPANYQIFETDITAQKQRAETNAESLAYLASTDWYVIRQQETGAEIPQEILAARAAARAAIVR